MSNETRSQRTDQPKPLEDLTYQVIGCAMRVHNKLGSGLKEAHYQQALSLELATAGLSFEAERPREIVVDGTVVGLLYVDHLIEGQLIVEEKAVPHLMTADEIAQVITYLCALELNVGLLINFGRNRLEYKRIFPPKDVARWRERIRRYLWVPKDHLSGNPLAHPLTDG
jgi:GxxExxY protein